MMQAISQLPHPLQALLATLFTWGITAAGAAMVFCCKNIRHDVLDGLMGASAGVMLTKTRMTLMIDSITLHNIPEGLSVGVAFGSLLYGLDGATLTAACMLALGIGIQNFPEGAAISLPLLRDGASKRRAFMAGMLSGAVEPIAGVIGALLVLRVRAALPYMLAFAGGAMIYVVVEELIPESHRSGKPGKIALFTLAGFALMMVLDVALSI